MPILPLFFSSFQTAISFAGRIYLGMHSFVDIIGGLALGLMILASWLTVHNYVDNFIISGKNGMHTHHNMSVILNYKGLSLSNHFPNSADSFKIN